MSHLIHASLSFQTRQRLRHSISSDMDLTPTNCDDEVQKLSETLQSSCHQANLQKQKGAELQGISIWKY